MEDIYVILIVVLFGLGLSLESIAYMRKRQVSNKVRETEALRISGVGGVIVVVTFALLQGYLEINPQATVFAILFSLLMPMFAVKGYFMATNLRYEPKNKHSTHEQTIEG